MVIEPTHCDSDRPEQWLCRQRQHLRYQLRADHAGSTDPYVIYPDGRIDSRHGKQWANRNWAVLDSAADRWRIVRTVSRPKSPIPKPGQAVVPVHRSFDAAEQLLTAAAQPWIDHLDRSIRNRVILRRGDRDAARIPERVAVKPTCLADLPTHRRTWLLADLATKGVTDPTDAERILLAHAEHRECRWRHITTVIDPLIAVLGDDGRYHLQVGDRLVCAEWRSDVRDEPWNPATHRVRYQYWSDGTRFQHRPPQSDRAAQHRLWTKTQEVDWSVTLTDTTAQPADIPPAQRCSNRESRQWWPSFHNPADQRGRIARRLTQTLGNRCGACRYAPAMVIDHDHDTGMIRGLLCRNCNLRVDSCVHVSGCPFADYLNDPPAAALSLPYPDRKRAKQPHRRASPLADRRLLTQPPTTTRYRPAR